MTERLPTNLDAPADEGLRCPECEYNLTGLVEEVCPECGLQYCRAQLLAQMSGAPAPIPIWGRRHDIGPIRAFVRTVLEVWLHPTRFAKRFPISPDHRDATRFSQWCLVIAPATVLIPHSIALGTNLTVTSSLLITALGAIVALLVCERMMAATIFASIHANEQGANEHHQSISIVQMARAHLLILALWIGPIGAALLFAGGNWSPQTVIVSGVAVIFVYWWACITCMATTYRDSVRNLLLSVILIPGCVVIGGIVGTMTCFLISAMLKLL